MSLSEEIRRLRELRDDGTLSAEEFERAKEVALSGNGEKGRARRGGGGERPDLGAAANTFVKFQIVMAIVGVIFALAFFFGFFLPQWNRSRSVVDSLRHGVPAPPSPSGPPDPGGR